MEIEELVHSMVCSHAEPTSSDKLYIFGRNPMLSCIELVSLGAQQHAKKTEQEKNSTHFESGFEFLTLTSTAALVRSTGTYPDVHRSGTLLKACTPRIVIKKPASYEDVMAACSYILSTIFLDDKPHWCVSAYEERDNEFLDGHGNADEDYYEMTVSAFREVLKASNIRKHTYIPPESAPDQLRVYDMTRPAHMVMPKKMLQKKIFPGGFECVLFHRGNEIVFCTTDSVLDITELEERDVKRPFFRAKLGMGAALARAMINISEQVPPNIIYDPFCGTGIILQEAFLLGYTPKGSDVDEKCIAGTMENLSWISDRMRKKKPKDVVRRIDFTYAGEHLHDVKAIVTEPYLGPALTAYPDKRGAKKLCENISERYQKYMAAIREVLSDDGVVVLIVPGFRTADDLLYTLDPDDIFTAYGFRIRSHSIQGVSVPYVFRHAPKEQRVERLIYVISRE